MSEAAKEIQFVYQVLESINYEVKLSITVRVDNIGSIFMSNKVAVSQRTKYIDIRYRFVQEFVMDGFLKIIFVKSEENNADLMTKNLSKDLYQKHSRKLISD